MSNKGLYKKYIVQKADGTEIDKNADYFVLRLDTDEAARKALIEYAKYTNNNNLVRDILKHISKYDKDNNNSRSRILSTEYDFTFDMYRQNRMIVSYYKYGDIKTNYGDKLVNAITNLEIRLKKYKDTGNKEYLLDIANFAMIEFMYPQHPNAHFSPNDSNDKIEGIPINDIKNISN